MNEALRVLTERRSIRKFKKDQVEEEKLQEILKAGEYAPSGMNKQPAVMVVVQDPATIEKLRRMNAEILGKPGIDPFYGAPTVIVVLADTGRYTYVEDGSLVLGNLMNAAFALGVDSCWIHRAKEEFASAEGKALLAAWGIPEHYAGVGHCILGYRDCALPAPGERKQNYIYRV